MALNFSGLDKRKQEPDLLQSLEWKCIGHNPTTMALGQCLGDEMKSIIARLIGLPNGHWHWQAWNYEQIYRGTESSREIAMFAAEEHAMAHIVGGS
ncbi:MAG TPA: hypothetical protein VF600_09000 [Abditibacteriaceae bacterium]|jgi:hypothetical protein